VKFELGNIVFVGIEKGDNDVDENGAVEKDIRPKGHVGGDPEKGWLTSKLLLPLHFVEHRIHALEEISDLQIDKNLG
jgi:hypothetical protein